MPPTGSMEIGMGGRKLSANRPNLSAILGMQSPSIIMHFSFKVNPTPPFQGKSHEMIEFFFIINKLLLALVKS